MQAARLKAVAAIGSTYCIAAAPDGTLAQGSSGVRSVLAAGVLAAATWMPGLFQAGVAAAARAGGRAGRTNGPQERQRRRHQALQGRSSWQAALSEGTSVEERNRTS